MKREKNKWQFEFYLGRDYRTIERGWKQIRFGIVNIHTLPEEGRILQKKHYNGFILEFYVWFPIDYNF